MKTLDQLILAAFVLMLACRLNPGPEPEHPIDLDKIPGAMLARNNAIRGDHDLKAYKSSNILNNAAQWWADEMVRTGFRHSGLPAAENIAVGYRTVHDVMDAWYRSPGHKRNLLSNQTYAGYGLSEDPQGRSYWCAIFTSQPERVLDAMRLTEQGYEMPGNAASSSREHP